MVKQPKKAKKSTIPSYKRTDHCSLIREPKIKGIRNYIKRIRMALEKERREQMIDKTNDHEDIRNSSAQKPQSKTQKKPDFFVNPLSPTLSFSSIRLCHITHLPSNYTDSRTKLEAYDKSVLLMIKEMSPDKIKMINGIRGFGRDLTLG